MKIETDRLILIPITIDFIKVIQKGEFEKLDNFGLTKSEFWPHNDILRILPIYEKQLEILDKPTGFEVWIIVKKENMSSIGDLGYKRLPNENGEVEIGYCVVENERKKGYCFEAVKALVQWGLTNKNVTKIKANCFASNGGSKRILEKLGMVQFKTEEELLFWELKR